MKNIFKRSFALGVLTFSTLAAHAGPVIDYLEEAARQTPPPAETFVRGYAHISVATANKLLKKATPVTRGDIPSFLHPYLETDGYEKASFFTLKEGEKQLFLATKTPPTKPGQFASDGLLTAPWYNDGVTVWHHFQNRQDDQMRLVTLPTALQKPWATIDPRNLGRLEFISPLALRGRQLSATSNPIGHALDAHLDVEQGLPAADLRRLVDAAKPKKISLSHVPSYLQTYLQNLHRHVGTPPADLRYYVLKESRQSIYYALKRGATLPREGKLTCKAYDDIALWEGGDGRMRLATVPRGDVSGLGETLTPKTLVRLQATPEDFVAAPLVKPSRSQPIAPPKAAPAPRATHTSQERAVPQKMAPAPKTKTPEASAPRPTAKSSKPAAERKPSTRRVLKTITFFESAAKKPKTSLMDLPRIPFDTANKMLKGATQITRKDVPKFLHKHFSAYPWDQKKVAFFTLDGGTHKLFFATRTQPKGDLLPGGYLTTGGWHGDGVTVWDHALRCAGDDLRLVTLPATLSNPGDTLHDKTISALTTTRAEIKKVSLKTTRTK